MRLSVRGGKIPVSSCAEAKRPDILYPLYETTYSATEIFLRAFGSTLGGERGYAVHVWGLKLGIDFKGNIARGFVE